MERKCNNNTTEQEPGDVAYHEVGHAVVAEALGGLVLKQTIVPEGKSLGHAIISFNHFPFAEKIGRLMATLAAGFVAEERIGKSDHSGCGSDMAKLDYLSEVASKFLYRGRSSAQSIASEAMSRARSLMPDRKTLFYRANILQAKKTI